MKKIIIVALGLLIGLGLIPVIKNTVDKASIETKSFTLVLVVDDAGALDEQYLLDNNNNIILVSSIYDYFIDIDNKETLTSPSFLTVEFDGNIYDNYILQNINLGVGQIEMEFNDGTLSPFILIISPSAIIIDDGDVVLLDPSTNNIVFQYDVIIEKPLLSILPIIYVIILLTSAVLYIKLGRE